jgi:chromosome segregation ATPase
MDEISEIDRLRGYCQKKDEAIAKLQLKISTLGLEMQRQQEKIRNLSEQVRHLAPRVKKCREEH